MKRRWFTGLLLFYVALDFADPVMPGAVSFLAGSVEAAHIREAPRVTRPSVALAAPAVECWKAVCGVLAPRPLMVSRRSGPAPGVALRRAPMAASDPSAPAEDH